MTLDAWLRAAAAALFPDSDSARLDAEVLARHALGLTPTGLITEAPRVLDGAALGALNGLLARRAHGEPIAYITGVREFWSLSLRVGPAVLIPRPETELLVEAALARIAPQTAVTIVDLGTGSGAIALALARERPRALIIATDASSAALGLARANAAAHGITNVEFRHGDWFTPLADVHAQMIVSNPPYIAANDPHLRRGDLRFEPLAALASGADGLDAIRHLVRGAGPHLVPGGTLLLEHGAEQAKGVARELAAARFTAIHTQADLAGHARIAVAATPAG